jgi:uracil-DNA glycosylase family 4
MDGLTPAELTPDQAAAELASLAADLRAWLESARDTGVLALPRGELPPRRSGAPGPRSTGARSAGPRSSAQGTAGPRTAGPRTAGPRTAGPRTAGPRTAPGDRGSAPARGGAPSGAPGGDRARPGPERAAPRQPPARAERPERVPTLERGAPRPGADRPSPAPAPREPAGDSGVQGGLWASLSARAKPVDPMKRLRDEVEGCRRCALCESRGQIVFGEGEPRADLMIIGEAPGPEEDRAGSPFAGPGGEMLDRMLENVLGLRRDQVYAANIVKCSPPAGQRPPPRAIAACSTYLLPQIEAVRPRLLLAMGPLVSSALLGGAEWDAIRGRWQRFYARSMEIPLLPTYHPDWLLENPGDKRAVFQHLLAVKQRYEKLGGRR